MEWIIGKEGDIKVNGLGVSRKHAKLTLRGDGSLILEDLNSTNGTFVNGQQILTKVINASDKIQLAGSVDIDLKPWIDRAKPEDSSELRKKFFQLKNVYDDYNKKKIKIQSETMTSVMVKRSLPMIVPAVMGAMTFFMEGWGKYAAGIGVVLSLIGISYGIHAASKDQSKLPEKLQEIEDQLRIDYVCPKCKNFLGNLPWQSLSNRGQCSFCKMKWNE